MPPPAPRRRAIDIVRDELRQLVTIKPSDRPWQMPFAAALANGLPLFVGAFFGHLEYGLISSLGGLVFLYLPETPMAHRMVSLMATAFGMIACYALGVMSHVLPAVMTPVLTFIAILVTMVCRFYRVGVPGSLFFIMAAAIGAYSPGDILQIPQKVGLIAMGSLLACLIAFFYSLFILSRRAPKPVEPIPPATFDFVVFDSLVIGLAVSIPLIIFGATLIMALLNRFPIIVVAGGALLGWIAGEVLATDPGYADKLASLTPHAKTILEVGCAVLVVTVGYFLQYRAKQRRHDEPVDLAAEKSKE